MNESILDLDIDTFLCSYFLKVENFIQDKNAAVHENEGLLKKLIIRRYKKIAKNTNQPAF